MRWTEGRRPAPAHYSRLASRQAMRGAISLIWLEVLLGFGAPLVWAVWELHVLRRDRLRAEAAARAAAEATRREPAQVAAQAVAQAVTRQAPPAAP